jgi:hypothetical protein
MTRSPNWQQELAQFFSQHRTVPFSWGTADCCTFAADAIKSFTSVDIAEDFRGTYTTEAGALAAINKVCKGTTAADAVTYAANKYGLKELPSPLFAQRGDLLIVNNAGNLIAGVLDLHGKAACVTDKGLYQFPLTTATKAYRV